jgi:uncharacterized membrane protein YtjA (UPF0391 family)
MRQRWHDQSRQIGFWFNHRPYREKTDMLGWSLFFLFVALVAGVLGVAAIAATAAGVANILFVIFLFLLVVSALAGAFPGRPPG